MSLLLDFISRNGLDVGTRRSRTHRQPVPTMLSTPGFKLLSQREPISREKKKKNVSFSTKTSISVREP